MASSGTGFFDLGRLHFISSIRTSTQDHTAYVVKTKARTKKTERVIKAM